MVIFIDDTPHRRETQASPVVWNTLVCITQTVTGHCAGRHELVAFRVRQVSCKSASRKRPAGLFRTSRQPARTFSLPKARND